MKNFSKNNITLLRPRITCLVCAFFLLSIAGNSQCPDMKNLWGRLRYATGTPREQLSNFLPTLDSIEKCSGNDSIRAMVFRKIGGLYYQRGDYLNALKYYPRFVFITRSNAGKQTVDEKELVTGYYWLSNIYGALNMMASRMKALDSCAYFAEKFNIINKAWLSALYARAEYYYDIGDFHRSAEYATTCERIALEYAISATNDFEHRDAMEYAISSLLWKVNAMVAIKDFTAAEAFLKQKPGLYRQAGFTQYLGTIYCYLAQVQIAKENKEKALDYFNQALVADRQAGFLFGCKQTMSAIGAELYRTLLNDPVRSRQYYRAALQYQVTDKNFQQADTYEQLNLYGLIGESFAQTADYDSAFHYYALAFNQLKPGADEKSILADSREEIVGYKKIYYVTTLVINKGDAYKKRYETLHKPADLLKAVEIYRTADQLLTRIKSTQTELRSKLFWRSDSRRLYEHAIDACFLMNNTTDAFYFFEKSRAVLLNDQLNEQRWATTPAIMEQTQLIKQLTPLELELRQTAAWTERYSELEKEVSHLKAERDRLQELIRQNNPLYYQDFVDTTFIHLKDVGSKLLKDHKAYFATFNGDSAVYAMLITASTSHLVKINKPDYDSTVAAYTGFLGDANKQNEHFDGYIQVASHLFHLLFRDLPLPDGRIILSPDGVYFPFESLVVKRDGAAVTYLLQAHALSYTYSARFLLNKFNDAAKSEARQYLGFAPVNYPAASSLSALNGSVGSLEKILTFFPEGVNRIESDASRNNFLNEFGHSKIVQLYTHASVSGPNGEPVLYFADSALSLSELTGEGRPATQLIVLSACETGIGQNYLGEGVFSFNRALAGLGIPSAVTNLWTIDNRSTYQVTELFYKYLSRGMPVDIALQQAKLEFMRTGSKEHQLPYYWAATIVAGKTQALDQGQRDRFPYIQWLIVALISGLIAWALIRRKSGNEKTVRPAGGRLS